MSKTLLAAIGLILAVGGFVLGQQVASRPAAEPEATPLGADAAREAIEGALGEPDAFVRAVRLGTLLPTLGPDGVPAVRTVLDATEWHYGAIELELLLRFWSLHDPEAAALWSFSDAPNGYNVASILATVERWATVDPLPAAAHVRKLFTFSGPNVEMAEIGLVRGWFASGQPGLVEFIQDLAIGPQRQRAISEFVRQKLERDGPEGVRDWAEGISDEDELFKLNVYRRVGSEFGKTHPEAATAWCDAHCEGPYGSNVRRLIAMRWGANDGLAVMQWLSTAPESYEREEAVLAAFGGWRRHDPEGVSAWFESMGPDGIEPWLAPASGRYGMMISRDRPEEALRWAAVMPNENRRHQIFITIARRWREQDEAAAEAWLAQSPLSEEEREKARTEPPTKPPPRRPRADRGFAPQ